MKKEKFPLRGLKDRLRIVLVRTRNPLNIGAAARAMSNFGFSHLRVVKPYEPAFRAHVQRLAQPKCLRMQSNLAVLQMRSPTVRWLLELQQRDAARFFTSLRISRRALRLYAQA